MEPREGLLGMSHAGGEGKAWGALWQRTGSTGNCVSGQGNRRCKGPEEAVSGLGQQGGYVTGTEGTG